MSTSAGSSSPAETEFRRISEAEWTWRLQELGSQFYWGQEVDARLPDVSAPAWLARGEHWRSVKEELAGLDTAALSARARVDLAVYLTQIEALIAHVEHRVFERPMNSDTAFWTDHQGLARVSMTYEQAQAFLEQLRQLPRWFDQHIENMRTGLRRGFAPPRVAMAGREGTARSVAEATSADHVAYLRPFTDLPATVGVERRRDLISAATAVIEQTVIPAYAALLDFLLTEYLPGLPEDVSVAATPGGTDFYRAQLREYTTTDLDPQEIHRIGLAEVASIRAEMAQVAEEAGFDDAATMREFMRTDPQFYVDTPAQLLKEAAWQCKLFDAVVHQFFGLVPRGRFGIIEPPPDLAPYYTAGRGGRDRYTLNTYNLPARPLYALPALTLHEAAPGHAFQSAFAAEAEQNPDYRREVYISAYGEGWALYCERLGVEMGIYRTPFEMMGMLSYQMWRAARLVIDPGIHALGWSRERAQDFLRQNTALSEHEITTEVDRYITWPGQAASYYLGQLAILELRRHAERTLGEHFDLRHFHDVILGLGSVPLEVLRTEVERAVAARATRVHNDGAR
ncbi:DUF885 domain-containing protein [Pseudactinotalea sp. Z1748]|uniref:DUF885 domain-containing protein n=1 Tax=Pseudactinotalea sp. Z1748 TaxID=3413027 RepID=UPI003C7A287E